MLNYSTIDETGPLPHMSRLDRPVRAMGSLIATWQVYFIASLGPCAGYIRGGLAKRLDFSAAAAETQSFGFPFAAGLPC